MTLAAALGATVSVPVPTLEAMPPLVPWWESALIGLLISAAFAYVATLARALWRSRSNPEARADVRRTFSRRTAWVLPALIVATIAVFQVDARWTTHRDDVATVRAHQIDQAAAQLASDLGDAYGVTVDPAWISVIQYPSRVSDIVQVTRSDGTKAECWMWIDAEHGDRTASLEIDTCTPVDGT